MKSNKACTSLRHAVISYLLCITIEFSRYPTTKKYQSHQKDLRLLLRQRALNLEQTKELWKNSTILTWNLSYLYQKLNINLYESDCMQLSV